MLPSFLSLLSRIERRKRFPPAEIVWLKKHILPGRRGEEKMNATYRPLIHVDLLVGEVPHLLEGVDRDENGPDVRKYPVLHVPLLQVVGDPRLGHLDSFILHQFYPKFSNGNEGFFRWTSKWHSLNLNLDEILVLASSSISLKKTRNSWPFYFPPSLRYHSCQVSYSLLVSFPPSSFSSFHFLLKLELRLILEKKNLACSLPKMRISFVFHYMFKIYFRIRILAEIKKTTIFECECLS